MRSHPFDFPFVLFHLHSLLLATVFCSGYFDEELQVRQSCFYKAPAAEAPRLQPFYTEEPTEEEKEEMEAQWEASKAGSAEAVAVGKDAKSIVAKLVSGIDEFDLSSGPGKKKASSDLVAAVTGIVDIPDDEAKARMAIGRIVMMHSNSSKDEVLEAIIDEFGLKAVNEEQSKVKAKTATTICACPANAPVLEAIMELSSLYFKEGNANAGKLYLPCWKGVNCAVLLLFSYSSTLSFFLCYLSQEARTPRSPMPSKTSIMRSRPTMPRD